MRTINQSDLDLVLYNLGKRGFILFGIDYELERPVITTQELIVRLVRDVGHSRGIEGLALVIDNDPPDYASLACEAVKEGVQNQVGYVLEGTLQVIKKHKPYFDTSKLEKAIEQLYEKRNLKEAQFLARLDLPNERDILSRNRAPEDLKWNIIGGVTYKQFDVQYRVYHNEALEQYKRKLTHAS